MMWRRLLRYAGFAVGGFLLVLLLCGIGGYLWLLGSLPQTEGDVSVVGAEAPIEILRNDHGLVTIRAESHRDALFGLGYVHAQDRLAQMELLRRIGTGRTAELIGRAGLRSDRLFRQLEFERLSRAAEAHLEPETVEALTRYAQGVNAFLNTPGNRLPPEFLLVGTPEPWEPWHSILWGKLMALQLSGNWREELQNARLSARLSPREMEELFPEQAADAPSTLTREMRQAALAPSLLEALPEGWQERRGASNIWALSPGRTESGGALLANDPHLGLGAPGTWYLARLETPEGVWAGATAPGVPGIVIGHNGSAAWGFTTTHSDTQDLVAERLLEGDDETYITPDGPRKFEVWTEEIRLRDGSSERVRLRRGRFGPVVSEEADLGEDRVLTLAWPALQEADTSADGLVRLNRARSLEDFVAAQERFVAPQQNIFFATAAGNIAFGSPALVPVRDGHDGSLPIDGAERSRIWTGFLPYEALPQAADPPDGVLINANNRPVGPDYPHLLGTRWPEPYRAERIQEVLQGRETFGFADMRALQMDEVSPMGRDLLPLLLAAEPAPGAASEAHALLDGWDGDMRPDRPEPLLLWAWLDSLHRALFEPKLGPLYSDLPRLEPRAIKGILERDDGRWCGPQAGDCPDLLSQTLSDALAGLDADAPGAPAELRWGDYHRVRISHFLLGRIPVLRDLFLIDLETGGGDFTVNRATPSRDPERRFQQVHGPGLRAVFDLSDLDASGFIITPGQSGNPLSRHFGDLAEAWRDGELVQLVAPERAEAEHLVLNPGTRPGTRHE